jgi:3',5'-nucleoside bisphosphate phosphatase
VTLRRPHGQSAPPRRLIDLHLHTTISDGRCTPRELVDRAADAGLAVIAATDHDTTASFAEVDARARAVGIEAVPGIEITAVEQEQDVHVLGYFFDPSSRPLADFLVEQRRNRLSRVERIAATLHELGMPIDVQPILDQAARQPGRSVGRPQVARALVTAGYVADVRQAFDLWLGRGCPAFVPRQGPSPETVIAVIHGAGGVASLAHPGRTRIDARVAALRDAGLDALEVYHCDHDDALVASYGRLADALGLLRTGGSDFHGDATHGNAPGAVTLPGEHWERLRAARHRHGDG